VQTGRTDSAQSSPRLDSGIVDPIWAPPSGIPAGSDAVRTKTLSASLVYGSIVLALVLIIIAIWGFGGFKPRTDLFKTMPPGTLFTTGPYEFRFIEATAQHKKDFDNSLYWEVIVIGEGRTTGKESISPNYTGDDGMFVSKDDVSQEVSLPTVARLGRDTGFDRSRFTPGLPLTAYSLEFRYKDTYRPGPTIRFAVSDLVYGKHYLASEEETWHNGTYRRQFYLPVRVLPPAES
jgi:hypothetical protein